MYKKRILVDTEFSGLSTGYATYTRQLLTSLHQTGKYEIAELGSYAEDHDPNLTAFPWKIYPNHPSSRTQDGQQEYQVFNQDVANQFGKYRFDKVVLDFRPDFVFNHRDTWMATHNLISPFRDFYHFVYMPTVDSRPQAESWLSYFTDSDSIFTYTDWSAEVIKNQCGNSSKVVTSVPPCPNYNIFKKLDKKQVRQSLGVSELAFVVGTVMRNQKRKQFPKLIEAFAKFAETVPNSILYMHTSIPDIGWDLTNFIKQSGVANKIYITYYCNSCKSIFASQFCSPHTSCKRCGNLSAQTPNTKHGIPEEALAAIYNTFDVFIQYASNEGFGIPSIEAAACQIPVFSVDYSAMEDVVRKVNGTPILVKSLEVESETNCLKAIPDEKDLTTKLIKFASLPQDIRNKKGFEARKGCEKHYTWDNVFKVWDKFFTETPVKDHRLTWLSPPRYFQPNLNIPGNLPNEDLVKWGYINILGKPNLINSYKFHKMVADLNNGFTMEHHGGQYLEESSLLGSKTRHVEFSRQQAMEELLAQRNKINYWESVRANTIK